MAYAILTSCNANIAIFLQFLVMQYANQCRQNWTYYIQIKQLPYLRKLSYIDSELFPVYEKKILEEVKKLHGITYHVSFVPSDELIACGGAVHCVTMQIPSIASVNTN